MAYDKVTKIDAIAKRKPYTREHLGKIEEYDGVHKTAATNGKALSQFRAGNTYAQTSMRMDRNGRLKRFERHGSGIIVTNFAARTSARVR